MAAFLSIPVLLITVMIQIGIISRIPFLQGTANLVLLVIIAWGLQEKVTTSWIWTIVGGLMLAYVSALPFFASLVILVIVNGLTRLFQQRIWQTPILAMLLISVLATFIDHVVSLFALRLNGSIIPLGLSISRITFPSALLNLILALPVYAVMHDMAEWLYPQEVEL